MALAQGTLVGRYRIEGVLGRGGMAVVYRARTEGLDRPVALKVLADDLRSAPEFADRFRREGQLQASLEHPHSIAVYEAGDSEHGLYLAMRLVAGPTLGELMKGRELGAARALALLAQVAEALDAAHARGLVPAAANARVRSAHAAPRHRLSHRAAARRLYRRVIRELSR